MRKLSVLAALLCLATVSRVQPQTATGGLEFTAKVTPTAAKPEPVRDFTFYVLTKSYDDIVSDIDLREGPPSRDKFIDDLNLSAQLRGWLHKHDVMDITLPGFDKLLT